MKIKDRVETFKEECLGLFEMFLDDDLHYLENPMVENSRQSKLSVIEKLFALAFQTNRMTGLQMGEVRLVYQKEIECSSGKKYYPDFTFCYAKNHGMIYNHLNLLIELDGHIWHEKTPEQVEKDKIRERDLINNGYILLRFSGREVYRDPFKVVDECVSKYTDLVADRYNKEHIKKENK